MTTTLIAVAQRAKARLFVHEGPGRGLTEIEDLVNPSARMSQSEIDADRPGSTHDSFGRRHPLEHEQTPKARAAEDFAREIARAIAKRRTAEGFDRLVLVAEPGFLGMLRAALDGPTARLVDGEVNKELTELRTDQLAPHLADVLAV